MADLRCRRRGRVRAKIVGLILAALLLADSAGAAIAQAAPRPDLSGRWLLNRALSENGEAKLEAAGAARSGIHGMLGSMLGGRRAEMEEMRRLVLRAPSSLIVRQNANRIVLSDGEGPPRTLVADGRSVNIDGREVLTRWEGTRLSADTTIGGGKVTMTYQRPSGAQLIVTTSADTRRGHQVSVRRVYDAAGER
jgi:hypothetical protein